MNVNGAIRSCLIFALLLSATPAHALDLGKVAQFAGGAVTSVLIHEGGHILVAWLHGADASLAGIAGTDFGFPDDPDHTNPKYFQAYRNVALGGYLAQNIATELILRRRDWHENPFALGIMWTGIFTDLNNVIAFYRGKKERLDLEAYEKWGGDAAIPATLMTSYSLFSLYRIFNETRIIPYIGKNMLGIRISF